MRNSGGGGTSRQQSISETGRMYAPPSLKGENLATVLDVAWHEQQRSSCPNLGGSPPSNSRHDWLGFRCSYAALQRKDTGLQRQTLDESDRIAWRTFLDNKSTELGRDVLNHEALHCVYRYKLPQVHRLMTIVRTLCTIGRICLMSSNTCSRSCGT